LLVFLPKSFYLNDLMAVAYIILMISAYFYNKGYKRAIYFNLIFLVYLVVNIYSPIPKIEYYKEGVVTISYKGEKEIFLLKKGINIEKYKKISLSNNINKDFNVINLKGRGKIYRDKNNLILNYNNKEYLINLSKGKIASNYDIIDCKYSSYSKIILFNNDVLVFN
ncbi:MAG: ComEC/Rec2 family competence protein, partial [Clostridium sp.]|nr:ComEC/Rec2 family competence protein [Clostridium sp.]